MFCPECGKELEDGSLYCPCCNWREFNHTQPEEKKASISDYLKVIKSNKKMVGIVIAVVAIIVLCVSISAYKKHQYLNSAEYKISQAEDMILNKQYKEAMNMISDVDTPEADAMREFVDLEMEVDDYIESYRSISSENASLFEAYSGIYNETTELMEKFSEYKENDDMKHWLTDRIKSKYDYYVEIRDVYYEEFYTETPPFYTLQCVLYNEVERQHTSENGTNFTKRGAQSRVADSQDALDAVEIWYNNTMTEFKVKGIEFSTVWESSEFYAVEECLYGYWDGLVERVKREIASEETYIDTKLEKWDLDDKLYRTSPDMDYKCPMDYGLQDIFSVDDMTHNSTVIMQNLDIAYMAYCLNQMQNLEF